MKTKTTTISPSWYSAVSTEFSLCSDGCWLTVGGNNHDVLGTTNMLEAMEWMRARTALNLAFELYLDDHPIMTKNPGSKTIELVMLDEAVAA